MAKSKVYFTNFRTSNRENQQQKLARLLLTAGMDQIDFTNKFVAIKIHFGEPGNLAYLRPNYAKTVAEVVKSLGGRPFLTDCNTLYVGGRKNALDHLDSAYENGFFPLAPGCPVIIADGLKGTDDVEVPVVGGQYVQSAKIGRAIMDADVIISLNHFKGHENTGFGGAIKNVGMGCGSRAGKMEMHNAGKPHIVEDRCVGCGSCAKICAHGAPTRQGNKMLIDQQKCVGCGRCIGVCPVDAVVNNYDEAFDILNCKMAEYAKAVVDGRPQFHVSLVMDVSPYCDCHSENDVPIVPDIGMFASFDPVALDLACARAVNAAQVNQGSVLAESTVTGRDHFGRVTPETNWESQIAHGKKIGLGSDDYELITI